MPKRTIAVMGATGRIGLALAQALLARGHAVVAIGRNASKLEALAKKRAQARSASFDDAKALAEAFRGSDAVFAMIPPAYSEDDLLAFQDRAGEAIAKALRTSGVRRLVSLSSTGAQHGEGTGPIRGLHRQEERLNAVGGLDVLHLRPAYFMENHLWSIPTIRNAGLSGTPISADLAFPQVATGDVAARAAELFDTLDWKGPVVHEFGGPRELTMAEATTVLGRSIGRPDLKYVQFPYSDAEQAMRAMGMKPGIAALMIEMYRGVNEGRVTMEQPLTSARRGKITIEDFAGTFAAAYRS
jgi:uncharacterized protein YbjT (DUF2867 family)